MKFNEKRLQIVKRILVFFLVFVIVLSEFPQNIMVVWAETEQETEGGKETNEDGINVITVESFEQPSETDEADSTGMQPSETGEAVTTEMQSLETDEAGTTEMQLSETDEAGTTEMQSSETEEDETTGTQLVEKGEDEITTTVYYCFKGGEKIGAEIGYSSVDNLNNANLDYDGYIEVKTEGTTVTVTPYANNGYEFMMLNLTDENGNVSTPFTKDYKKKRDGSTYTAEEVSEDNRSYSFTVDSSKTTETNFEPKGTIYAKMPLIKVYFDAKEGLLNGDLLKSTPQEKQEKSENSVRSWLGPIGENSKYGTLHVGVGGSWGVWNGVDCDNGDYVIYDAGEGKAFKITSASIYSRLRFTQQRFGAIVEGSNNGDAYTQIIKTEWGNSADNDSIKRMAWENLECQYQYIRLKATGTTPNISLLRLYGSVVEIKKSTEYQCFINGQRLGSDATYSTEEAMNDAQKDYDGYIKVETNGTAVTVTPYAKSGYKFMMLNLTDDNGVVSTPLTKDYRKKLNGANASAEKIGDDVSYSFTVDENKDTETGFEKLGTQYKKMPSIAAYFDSEEGLLNDTLMAMNIVSGSVQQTQTNSVRSWLGPVDGNSYGTLHVGVGGGWGAWDGTDSANGNYITYYAGEGKAFKLTAVNAYSRLYFSHNRFAAEISGSYDNEQYVTIVSINNGTTNQKDSIIRHAETKEAEYPYIRLTSKANPSDISLLKLYGSIVEAREPDVSTEYLVFKEGEVVEKQTNLDDVKNKDYEGYAEVKTTDGKSVEVTVTANDGYDFMLLNLTDEDGNVTTPLSRDYVKSGEWKNKQNENDTYIYTFALDAECEIPTDGGKIGTLYKEMPSITAYFAQSDRISINSELLEMEPYEKQISDKEKPITSWLNADATLCVGDNNWSGKDVAWGDYVTYSAGTGNAFHLTGLDIYSRWGFSHDRFGAAIEASNDGKNFYPILTTEYTSKKEQYSVSCMTDTKELKVRMLRIKANAKLTDVSLLNIFGAVKKTDASELSDLTKLGDADKPADLPEITGSVTWLDITSEAGFTHPGIGITKKELVNIRKQIEDKKDPWYTYYTKMAGEGYASRSFACNNLVDGNIRYDSWSGQNIEGVVGNDGQRAYTQALMYVITGDEIYRSNAMKIIRVYEQMVPEKFASYMDCHIHAPGPFYKMVQAAEILRYTACTTEEWNWTVEDTEKFTTNFVDPVVNTFLNVNDKFMNQHNFPLFGTLAAAIFKDDMESYKEKVEWTTVNDTAWDVYYTGSIKWLYRWMDNTSGSGKHVQLVEMGRDLAHAGDDAGTMPQLARMIHLQGTKVDPKDGTVSTAENAETIYEFLDHCILRGTDYFCRFEMGYDIDWTPVQTSKEGGMYTKVSNDYRGRLYTVGLADLYYVYRYQLNYTDEQLEELAPYYMKAFKEKNGPTYYAAGDAGATDLGMSGYDGGWLYIPAEAADDPVASHIPESYPPSKKYIFELDKQYSIINDSNTVVESTDEIKTRNEGSTGYIHATASDGKTRFAVYNVSLINRKGEAKVGLRIRTDGMAKLEIKRENNSEPFQVLALPDTGGKWRTITFDMGCKTVTEGQYPLNTHLMYFNVVGEGTSVDFDHINVDAARTLTVPEFKNYTDSAVKIVAAAGDPISCDFSATDANIFERNELTYTLQAAQGEAEDAQLDSAGQFTWTPASAGSYKWYVVVSDGAALGMIQLEIVVDADRRTAVESVRKGIDWSKEYLSITVEDFDSAEQKAFDAVAKTVDEFRTAMEELQQAANSMEELNPKLADGSLNFPKMIKATSLESGNVDKLIDNDSVTFTGDLYSKYFTLDFGAFYRIKVSEFQLQARNIWPNRTERKAVSLWVQLTGKHGMH